MSYLQFLGDGMKHFCFSNVYDDYLILFRKLLVNLASSVIKCQIFYVIPVLVNYCSDA